MMLNKTENSKTVTKRSEKKSTFFQKSNSKTLGYNLKWMTFILCAATIFNCGVLISAEKQLVKTDFESKNHSIINAWGKTKVVARAPHGHCLMINERSCAATKILPCNSGRINISFDLKLTDMKMSNNKKYRVCWISVNWYKSNASNAKPVGHSDIFISSKAAPWRRLSKSFTAVPQNKYFQITFFNAAKKGTFWIDNVEVSTGNIEINLLEDPSFKYPGRLGADNWLTPKGGKDWDGLTLFTKGAETEVTDAERISGKTSLHIKGNATVVSRRFQYNGGKISLTGWIKTKGVSQGKTPWSKAGVQIVYYNDKGAVSGHSDLKLLKGDNEWKRYVYDSVLPQQVKSFEIWLRIFEGAGGEAWFDDFTLRQKNSIPKAPYNPRKASVSIDANSPTTKQINPLWSNAVILYPRWILAPIGRRNVALCKKAGLTSLRVFDPIQNAGILKRIDVDGNPEFDWTLLDKAMDSIVSNNIDPLITIECTPNQISSKPDQDNNVYTNKYPPKDFELWGRVVEGMLLHLINRYGKERVARWYFDIWNEPEASRYFKGTLEEYLKVYDQALAALLRVEKRSGVKLQKGTMSSARQGYFKPLFEHLEKCDTLGNVDFLSFHIYTGTKGPFANYAAEIAKAKKTRDSYEELKGKPLLITEYNGNSMPGEVYRDNHVIASMIVKAARVFLDNNVKRAYFHSAIEFAHKKTKNLHFCGGCGLITKSGVPKASYNALLLLNKLTGGNRIILKISNEPIDGVAVLMKDEVLRIILTAFDDSDLNTTAPTDVSVTVDWKRLPKNVKATLIRLDAEHGDAYTEFLRLGKPKINDPSNKADVKCMLKAAALKNEKFDNFSVTNGKLKFNIALNRNSVIFLEFK